MDIMIEALDSGMALQYIDLSYACDSAKENGCDYIESYPSDGEFNPNLCCGNRSMYESQGFTIISVSDGIVARKKLS